MTIENSCFVSYPRATQGRFWDRIVIQLKSELENRLGALVREKVYMDIKNIQTGYEFEKALAKAICQSACMIVVFTPLYESNPGRYCLREFLTMEVIEGKRMAALRQHGFDSSHRMIIPIVVRGDPDEDLPDKIKKIQYYDISKILLTGKLTTPEMGAKIGEIAQYIYKHCKIIKEIERKEPIQDCDSYELLSEKEAIKLWGIDQQQERKSKEIDFPGS